MNPEHLTLGPVVRLCSAIGRRSAFSAKPALAPDPRAGRLNHQTCNTFGPSIQDEFRPESKLSEKSDRLEF